ncbi:hypothetical protein GCK72_001643 [Caenorhabditis remanei]|uniref:Uncharacterized protein n=1 Tax=Caenorhabditis remanei TaxID=31234 RepID=A0A6A5HSW1_CAERE|nr:hypothetical protein GCK72_001643 [Caenorhabditis remanei]KAF1769826.1 hypothetical protein GCK72_001643 [Caenorhabditis remanei]
MFKPSLIILLLVILALLSSFSSASIANIHQKKCMKKLASYASSVCDGPHLVADNVEEIILNACLNQVDLDTFISQICP